PMHAADASRRTIRFRNVTTCGGGREVEGRDRRSPKGVSLVEHFGGRIERQLDQLRAELRELFCALAHARFVQALDGDFAHTIFSPEPGLSRISTSNRSLAFSKTTDPK